jgi:hypothetical protein
VVIEFAADVPTANESSLVAVVLVAPYPIEPCIVPNWPTDTPLIETLFVALARSRNVVPRLT